MTDCNSIPKTDTEIIQVLGKDAFLKIVYGRKVIHRRKIARRIRQRIFDYEDEGKYDKAARILDKIKTHARRFDESRAKNNENRKLQNYQM